MLAALLLLCYCCRNRLPCRDAPVKGEVDRVRMELENPRTDVTVDLGGSSAIDGGHSGGVYMPPSKIGAMHGEQPSPADRLEEELRKTMSDAGGESQVRKCHLIFFLLMLSYECSTCAISPSACGTRHTGRESRAHCDLGEIGPHQHMACKCS